MRRVARFLLVIMAFAVFAASASADQASAPIAQAMDRQLPESKIEFNGTLPQAIQKFGDLTAVTIETDNSVYDVLPWGDLTTFSARFVHLTLRQAINAICVKLGLQYELQPTGVVLRPLPALLRLGRRCTVGELAWIDLLGETSLQPKTERMPATELIDQIDERLSKTPLAVEDRAFDASHDPDVAVARNMTLIDALEALPLQTDGTWYPWGRRIVVLRKRDQVRMLLARKITLRYNNDDVANVLLDLAQRSSADFRFQPGALQHIPPQFRSIHLDSDNATIEQTIESLCGLTGLAYDVEDDGVHFWMPADSTAATQPMNASPASTQPAN